MSTLQIGLAIAGGVVLAAVVAHSAWTSRKNKPRQAEPQLQETPPAPAPASFLPIKGHPQEPSFDSTPIDEVQHGFVVSGSLDPVTDIARSMMEEATAHAQRVPDEAELARIAQTKAAAAHAANVAAER